MHCVRYHTKVISYFLVLGSLSAEEFRLTISYKVMISEFEVLGLLVLSTQHNNFFPAKAWFCLQS